MTDKIVQIHGKSYMTVAGRVEEAHAALKKLTIMTEVLYQNPVVVKATVTTDKGVFTGISAANPNKSIEKMSPYEVAETSAVGRALGFAGYGIVDGIATADEMNKADSDPDWIKDTDETTEVSEEPDRSHCPIHNVQMKKYTKNGKSWYSHQPSAGKWCNGNA
jgi:hypothetical protein